MSIVSEVSLHGVWGERDFHIDFFPDVNFLIGSNGSGKTTIINIVAAALTGDYQSLLRFTFSSIECSLLDRATGKKATVSIRRPVKSKNEPRASMVYEIKRDNQTTRFELGDFAYYKVHFRHGLAEPTQEPPQLAAELKQLVKLRWLSVHRTPAKSRADEHGSFESTVDRRLNHLSNELVRYFSKQAARREEETANFVKQVFLSLVYREKDGDVIAQTKQLDLDKLEGSLEAIFEQFKVSNPRVLEQLRHHFSLAKSAVSKNSYPSDELVALVGIRPMHRVVEEWNKSLARQVEIEQPQRQFLDILNSQFKNKHLSINQKNELQAVLSNGRPLSLLELSSGEKQLLIILGEALVQERAEFIYIADEPELSLHVSWQEQLTANLRKVNPNAQVIFATHSPDIVSEYGNRVIDMERLPA